LDKFDIIFPVIFEPPFIMPKLSGSPTHSGY
jgi:hypothetical protein